MSGCKWVAAEDGDLPDDAVEGGKENGEKTYVGRANFNGGLIPGKVVPTHSCCYISDGGKEHKISKYEVLVSTSGTKFSWAPSECGSRHPDSIVAGKTKEGDQLFVGRMKHDGHTLLGKYHSLHCCVYAPYNGKEEKSMTYEVLIKS